MPKEIPATTLIFDCITDVTRKKHPCRGGKGGTWLQRLSPQHTPAPGEDAPILLPDLVKVLPLSVSSSQPSSIIKGRAAHGLLPRELG